MNNTEITRRIGAAYRTEEWTSFRLLVENVCRAAERAERKRRKDLFRKRREISEKEAAKR